MSAARARETEMSQNNQPAKRPALGRGLSALLPGAPAHAAGPRGLTTIAIEQLSEDREQPRRHFDQAAIDELSASIKARGIIQPILVRRTEQGVLRIVAGERRYRAARQAGLTEVPVIIKEISEAEAFEVALIENIQRQDLNPVEEAEAYHRLVNEHGLTQEELAGRVGKERSTITNSLRLLKLPDEVKRHLVVGAMSTGHAKALLGVEDPEAMNTLASQVVQRGLSVRETEKLVQKQKTPREPKQKVVPDKELGFLARQLERATGRPCDLKMKTAEAGELVLRFEHPDEAQELLRSLLDALSDRAMQRTKSEVA